MAEDQHQAPCLVAGSGEDQVRIDLVGANAWTVGRGKNNHIVLKDEMVSRNHAMIQRTGNEFLLVEFGSRNGSFVNGKRVAAPARLSDGDRVKFGGAEFTFQARPATAPAENSELESEALEGTSVLLAHQQITALVVDLEGLIALSNELEEAKLAQLVGGWIQKAGKIFQEYGSWGRKYLGDAVVAVWIHEQGPPEVAELQKVFAALSEMVEMTHQLGQEFGLSDPVPIAAGLNTGKASVDSLGAGAYSDFPVLGDAVSRAFELRSASTAAGLDLLLGAATFQSLRSVAGDLFEEQAGEPSRVFTINYDDVPAVLDRLQVATPTEETADPG